MPNVINLEEHLRLLRDLKQTDDHSYEQFLVDEGLDLMASFRSIKNGAQRLALRDLVRSVSKAATEITPQS